MADQGDSVGSGDAAEPGGAGEPGVRGPANGTDAPPPKPGLYKGFGPGQRLAIMAVLVGMAVVVVVYAGFAAKEAGSTIPYGFADRWLLLSLADGGHGDARVVEAFAHGRAIASQLVLGYLAIAAGIALMWLGFALSVLGADGAFQLAAQFSGRSLSFAGATPGVLALGLGAALAAVGATRSYFLEFDPTQKTTIGAGADGPASGHGPASPLRERGVYVPGQSAPDEVAGAVRQPGKRLSDSGEDAQSAEENNR